MRRATSMELLKRVSSCELVATGKGSGGEDEKEEMIESAVRVVSDAKCAFCVEGDVDTQLRPCMHLFHGRCLKPWLQVGGAGGGGVWTDCARVRLSVPGAS